MTMFHSHPEILGSQPQHQDKSPGQGYPQQPSAPQLSNPQEQPNYVPVQTYPQQTNFAPVSTYPQQRNYVPVPTYPQQPQDAPYPGFNNLNSPDTDQPVTKIVFEDEDMKEFVFSNKSIRLGFIRKVYGILTFQVSLTFCLIALFTFYDDGREFLNTHYSSVMWTAGVIFFITMIMLACCDIHQQAPLNFICLTVFTLSMATMVSVFTTDFDKEVVFIAAILTLIATILLSLFSLQTKIDFTTIKVTVYTCTTLVTLNGIIFFTLPARSDLVMGASVGVFLYCFYVIYDTQLLMGKDRDISPEDYIFASIIIYVDVVYMFIPILILINKIKKKSDKGRK